MRLSIHDFGTGYSSLPSLQSLPLSHIRIDRRFIKTLPQARRPNAPAIISMARSFGLTFVDEGSSTPLSSRGCEVPGATSFSGF